MMSLRKCHILKPENSSPNQDSNLQSSIGDGLGKQTYSPLQHAWPQDRHADHCSTRGPKPQTCWPLQHAWPQRQTCWPLQHAWPKDTDMLTITARVAPNHRHADHCSTRGPKTQTCWPLQHAWPQTTDMLTIAAREAPKTQTCWPLQHAWPKDTDMLTIAARVAPNHRHADHYSMRGPKTQTCWPLQHAWPQRQTCWPLQHYRLSNSSPKHTFKNHSSRAISL